MQLLGEVPNRQQLSEAGSFLAHAAKTLLRLAAALVTASLLRAVLELPASLEPGCLTLAEVRILNSLSTLPVRAVAFWPGRKWARPLPAVFLDSAASWAARSPEGPSDALHLKRRPCRATRACAGRRVYPAGSPALLGGVSRCAGCRR